MIERTLLVMAFAVASLAGCSFFGSGASGPYLATKLCGVHIDGKTNQAHLRVVLAILKPPPRSGVLEVEFENPSGNAAPLLVVRTITGNERTIDVVSPPLKHLRPRAYKVVARVYATADKKQMLGTHTHRCESLVDQRDLLR